MQIYNRKLKKKVLFYGVQEICYKNRVFKQEDTCQHRFNSLKKKKKKHQLSIDMQSLSLNSVTCPCLTSIIRRPNRA